MKREHSVLWSLGPLALLLVACAREPSKPTNIPPAEHAPTAAGVPSAGAGLAGDGRARVSAGASVANPSREASASPGKRRLDAVGIQLYTLRTLMQEDFEGTLRKVASIGYREVEFAGLFGHEPAEVRRLLAELNLKAVGSHVDWNRIRDDRQGVIEETLALGSHYLVVPSVPKSQRETLTQWEDWLTALNEVGRACAERGLELAYHNHAFEFAVVEGVVPYDLILQRVDRSVVKMEVDLFWLAKANRQPQALFAAYPGGFPLAHVKDMRRSDAAMVDVGQGELDFASVFAQSEVSGMTHFIVEHDNPPDPLLAARNSFAYLEQLTF